MKFRAALLILIIVLPLIPSSSANESPPTVVILSNEADMPTAKFIGDLFNQSGLNYTIMGPESFTEALKNYEVLILLGGPEAYDGMGNITSTYIPPKNASTLIEEPKAFLISIFKGNRDIIVLAGHTRGETLEAASYFFKDPIRITLLWGWAGYPVDFRVGTYAIYYIEERRYDQETGRTEVTQIRNLKKEVLNLTEINGTMLYNVTSTLYYKHLGVNNTIATVNLVDGLGRLHYCRMVHFMDGNVTKYLEGCPKPERGGGIQGATVYVIFKMEAVGNRTHWKIGDWTPPPPRTVLLPVGNGRIKGAMIIKMVFEYPSWKMRPEFSLDYVNPSVPFGGLIIDSHNRVLEGGHIITDEYTTLVALKS